MRCSKSADMGCTESAKSENDIIKLKIATKIWRFQIFVASLHPLSGV
jgi:hypothetical protein